MLQIRYHILEDALNICYLKHIFHEDIDYRLSWLLLLSLSNVGIYFSESLSLTVPFSNFIGSKVKPISEFHKHALKLSCEQGIEDKEYRYLGLVPINNELSIKNIDHFMWFLLSLRVILIFVALVIQTKPRIYLENSVLSIYYKHFWRVYCFN